MGNRTDGVHYMLVGSRADGVQYRVVGNKTGPHSAVGNVSDSYCADTCLTVDPGVTSLISARSLAYFCGD